MNDTINYYNDNAKEYFEFTLNADMSENYAKFLKYLSEGSYILDAGCGSGRDSKFFLSSGYKVKAIDASEELCALASNYIGQEVENIRFKDINFDEVFDGIWANASLLHVHKDEISEVIQKMRKALKEHGIFYASFKYGNTERIQGPRYYNDLDENSIKQLFSDFNILELWLSDDAIPGRTERWVNIIAEK